MCRQLVILPTIRTGLSIRWSYRNNSFLLFYVQINIAVLSDFIWYRAPCKYSDKYVHVWSPNLSENHVAVIPNVSGCDNVVEFPTRAFLRLSHGIFPLQWRVEFKRKSNQNLLPGSMCPVNFAFRFWSLHAPTMYSSENYLSIKSLLKQHRDRSFFYDTGRENLQFGIYCRVVPQLIIIIGDS